MSKWPIAMIATVLFAATAWAQPAAPRDLSMYKEAPVSGGGLLVAAYAVMWLLVAAAVWRLMRAQSKLERDVEALERRLERGP